MEGKTLQTFYTQLVLMPRVLHYAQYVLLAVGCVLLLIPIIYQIRSQVGGSLGRAAHCLPAGGRGRGAWMGRPSHPAVPVHSLSLEPASGSLGRGAVACISCILHFHLSTCSGRLPVGFGL